MLLRLLPLNMSAISKQFKQWKVDVADAKIRIESFWNKHGKIHTWLWTWKWTQIQTETWHRHGHIHVRFHVHVLPMSVSASVPYPYPRHTYSCACLKFVMSIWTDDFQGIDMVMDTTLILSNLRTQTWKLKKTSTRTKSWTRTRQTWIFIYNKPRELKVVILKK